MTTPTERPALVWSCMADGPHIWQVTYEDEVVEETSCTRQRGHTQEHQWFSDDGSVRVTWYDEWKLGEGEWRKDMADDDTD